MIRNQAYGTAGAGDKFGFVAQQIGSFKLGATTLPLTPAPTEVIRVRPTLDLFAREVA